MEPLTPTRIIKLLLETQESPTKKEVRDFKKYFKNGGWDYYLDCWETSLDEFIGNGDSPFYLLTRLKILIQLQPEKEQEYLETFLDSLQQYNSSLG